MADSIKMGKIVDNELFAKSIGDIDMGAIIHCDKDFEWDDEGPVFNTNVYFSEGSTFNISQTYEELVAKLDSCRPLSITGGFRYSRDNDNNGWIYYPYIFDASIFFGDTQIHWNAETCFAYYGLSDVDNMITIEEFRALPDDAEITIDGYTFTKGAILSEFSAQLTSFGLPQDFIEISSLDTLGRMEGENLKNKEQIAKDIIIGGCYETGGQDFYPALYIYGPQNGEAENTIHISIGDSLMQRLTSHIIL